MVQAKPSQFNLESHNVIAAAPAQPRISSGISGDNTSRQALSHLNASLRGVKQEIVQQYLRKASIELNRGRHDRAEKWALKALEIDEKSGISWHVLGMCREMAGDFASSISCYEAALTLMPDDGEILNNLGRLASRMGDDASAEKFSGSF
ncbi:MAG: hypothetical protein CGW95_07415 [Phenylobacterium zucineum]|nr:MAG: hypothetical protein CGW95_07415 [Phenylobacterium zucineum]